MTASTTHHHFYIAGEVAPQLEQLIRHPRIISRVYHAEGHDFGTVMLHGRGDLFRREVHPRGRSPASRPTPRGGDDQSANFVQLSSRCGHH